MASNEQNVFYVCEQDARHDDGSVLMFEHNHDNKIVRMWYADAQEQVGIALWLVECQARVIFHMQGEAGETTTWECTRPRHEQVNAWLAEDLEYDEWIDSRWAEIQDHQALMDDALENW